MQSLGRDVLINVVANLIAGAMVYMLGVAGGYFVAQPLIVTISVATILLIPGFLLGVHEWTSDTGRRAARAVSDTSIALASLLITVLLAILTAQQPQVYLKIVCLLLTLIGAFVTTVAAVHLWSALRSDHSP